MKILRTTASVFAAREPVVKTTVTLHGFGRRANVFHGGRERMTIRADIAPSPTDLRSEGQATYGMANPRPERTGLSFIVFISQRDDARHAARVKVSPGPKVKKDVMGSYSVEPFKYRAGLRLASSDEDRLEKWVAANRTVLLDYWDGVIEYTEDALARLKAV